MQTAEHKLSEASEPESCLATKTTLLETRNITASLSTMNNFHSGWTDDTNSKQTALWERRVRTLRKMLADFDQARKYILFFSMSHSIIKKLFLRDNFCLKVIMKIYILQVIELFKILNEVFNKFFRRKIKIT